MIYEGGNDFVDSGVENPEEKEGLQQRLQEYENKLNASTFERDRANIKLGKANCELDKLRGDLEMRKRLLIGSYKDLVGCSNNLGEQTECGVEQEICAALASLTRWVLLLGKAYTSYHRIYVCLA